MLTRRSLGRRREVLSSSARPSGWRVGLRCTAVMRRLVFAPLLFVCACRDRPGTNSTARDPRLPHRRRAAGEGQGSEAVRAEQGRAMGQGARADLLFRPTAMASVLRKRLSRRRLHAGCRISRPRRRLQLGGRARQRGRPAATSGRRVSFVRRACSIAADRSRSSAAGARPPRSGTTAWAPPTPPRMTARSTASRSHMSPAILDVRPWRHWLVISGGLDYSRMESWPGAGLQPFDRGGLHPRDRSGPWRDADLPARVWHAGRRFPARARLCAPRRILRGLPPWIRRQRQPL